MGREKSSAAAQAGAKLSTQSTPTLRIIAMPADANPYGDIFGGWLMGQMDLAAGVVAAGRARGRAVTVAADGMVFHNPVKVGDEVSVYAELIGSGHSSMSIFVQAWRRDRHGVESVKVTEARFTFVAVGGDGRPVPLPTF